MEEKVQEESAADKRHFPCAQCGARLDFVPGTGSLACPYCGTANPIPQAEKPIEELDYRAFLAQVSDQQQTQEAQRIKCGRCAAETTVPAEVTSGMCPFCGANIVFTGTTSRLIKPASLLPFKITQKEAFADFKKWIKGLWFAPGDLKRYAQSEARLAGIYVPYWTYDCQATSSYRGERGDHYWVDESYTAQVNGKRVTRTRRVRRTRWQPAGGKVWNSFDDILVPASSSLPKKYAERLEPWDLENLVPYTDAYLAGFRAESYQVNLGDGFSEAQRLMDPEIRRSICQDIGGDEQRIHSVKTQYGNITFKHLMLPIWMSAYRFKSKVYRILINARTGEVQGERPYSAWKIAGAILAALAVAALILALSQTG